MTSSFTLSPGTTDNSSASSALFDGKPRDVDDYPDEGRVLLQSQGREVSDEDLQQQKWMKLIVDHTW
jgi:hypothetical protein